MCLSSRVGLVHASECLGMMDAAGAISALAEETDDTIPHKSGQAVKQRPIRNRVRAEQLLGNKVS